MAKPSPKSSPWLIVNTPPTKTCLPPRCGLQRPSYMFCQVSVFSLRKCLSGLSLVCVFSLVYSCTCAFGMCGRWKRLQRLMWWNRGRQLAECTAMTPADSVDKESTGHIMFPGTDTYTHSLCDAISVHCPGFTLFSSTFLRPWPTEWFDHPILQYEGQWKCQCPKECCPGSTCPSAPP